MKGRGKKNFFVLLKQLVELVSAHQRQKKKIKVMRTKNHN